MHVRALGMRRATRIAFQPLQANKSRNSFTRTHTHTNVQDAAAAAAAGDVVGVVGPHFRPDSDDNLFHVFRRICERLAAESSYLGKTAILHTFFLKASMK